jgi:hypothetical protein
METTKYNALEQLNIFRKEWVADEYTARIEDKEVLKIKFQTGGTATNAKNGIFIEDLLVLAYAKLNEFNEHLPCSENSLALTKIEEAILWLTARKAERDFRWVYGTEEA